MDNSGKQGLVSVATGVGISVIAAGIGFAAGKSTTPVQDVAPIATVTPAQVRDSEPPPEARATHAAAPLPIVEDPSEVAMQSSRVKAAQERMEQMQALSRLSDDMRERQARLYAERRAAKTDAAREAVDERLKETAIDLTKLDGGAPR